MTKKQARVLAYRYAYEALQKFLDCGESEQSALAPEDVEKVEEILDQITQRAFERWQRAAGE